jgi:hypothetical protein
MYEDIRHGVTIYSPLIMNGNNLFKKIYSSSYCNFFVEHYGDRTNILFTYWLMWIKIKHWS